jgi:hypothetical protein
MELKTRQLLASLGQGDVPRRRVRMDEEMLLIMEHF